ncbi:hypothetical protein GCM10017744_002850 [Streptomyces antimycoticus]
MSRVVPLALDDNAPAVGGGGEDIRAQVARAALHPADLAAVPFTQVRHRLLEFTGRHRLEVGCSEGILLGEAGAVRRWRITTAAKSMSSPTATAPAGWASVAPPAALTVTPTPKTTMAISPKQTERFRRLKAY